MDFPKEMWEEILQYVNPETKYLIVCKMWQDIYAGRKITNVLTDDILISLPASYYTRLTIRQKIQLPNLLFINISSGSEKLRIKAEYIQSWDEILKILDRELALWIIKSDPTAKCGEFHLHQCLFTSYIQYRQWIGYYGPHINNCKPINEIKQYLSKYLATTWIDLKRAEYLYILTTNFTIFHTLVY